MAKAKEAAREAEKMITLGKKNTNASMTQAQAYLYVSKRHLFYAFEMD